MIWLHRLSSLPAASSGLPRTTMETYRATSLHKVSEVLVWWLASFSLRMVASSKVKLHMVRSCSFFYYCRKEFKLSSFASQARLPVTTVNGKKGKKPRQTPSLLSLPGLVGCFIVPSWTTMYPYALFVWISKQPASKSSTRTEWWLRIWRWLSMARTWRESTGWSQMCT